MTSVHPRRHESPFLVLMVCTGNVARSPLAEQLFAARIAPLFHAPDSAPIAVGSAGVRALVGDDMTAESRRVAGRYGVEAVRHSARQIDRALIESADLVLGANRAHRRFIVETAPRASRAAFTLVEFAHVTQWLSAAPGRVPEFEDADLPTRLRAIRDVAARQRGVAPPPEHATHFDVADPYGQSRAVYDEVGRRIAESVDAIARNLHKLSRPAGASTSQGKVALGLS